MISGLLIRQSLESLDLLGVLKITKEDKWDISDAVAGQDKIWDIIYFEFVDERIDEICKLISENLKNGKWFVDFRDGENVYLVFKNKVFKYKKGDANGRKEVEQYALSIGIPKTQLGWEE